MAFIAQVYAVALYVEGEKAARELGIRDRGGFFAVAYLYLPQIYLGFRI